MKRAELKNLNRRTKIYAAVLLFGVIAVLARMAAVQVGRGRQIVSFVSEWSRYGKPVIVREMAAMDVPVYTKFTVIIGQDGSARGFVTGDIKDKLAQGQEVYPGANSGIPCGTILSIGQELDMETGMFPVAVAFSSFSGAAGSKLVLFAQTQTLKAAWVVPNNVVDISKEGTYVWKVEDGKARKIKVKVGSRNGYGTLITDGIASGDAIVFMGQYSLGEGQRVNIVGRKQAAGTGQDGMVKR